MKSENKKAPVNDPLKSSHMFDHNQIVSKRSILEKNPGKKNSRNQPAWVFFNISSQSSKISRKKCLNSIQF